MLSLLRSTALGNNRCKREACKSGRWFPYDSDFPCRFFVWQTGTASARLQYDQNRSESAGPSEAEQVEGGGGVILGALLDKDLLWVKAGNAESIAEKIVSVTRLLVTIETPRKVSLAR